MVRITSRTFDAGIADAFGRLVLHGGGEQGSHLRGRFLRGNLRQGLLRGEGLGGAVDDNAILDRPTDQPMSFIRTGGARLDAGRAKVVVATETDAAVVMLIGDGATAGVAVDEIGTRVR